ncbi:class I SAM-dependent methyltransferase [Streptomyces sp. NBC_00829]|uniref:class I SAM-dependent methyltransferase n=1 Tax=Streptomyces sp. NBC_00829 TaxID=2903679 RepID=UPI00386A375D|nr:class I SAM-dependent methyltransferase [Streptomyces sp. NBC_00829]
MSAAVLPPTRKPGYWDDCYAKGTRFRPVNDEEQGLFRAHVRPETGMTTIDVGCGWGQFAHTMATAWGLDTTGYDFSPLVIREAAAKFTHPHLRFREHDFNVEPIPADLAPGSVDIVVCRLALAFLDRARFLTDVRRWLRPDGVLYVMTPVHERQPAEASHRGISEQVIVRLGDGWAKTTRYDLCNDGCLTAVVLRGPQG